MNSHQSFIPGTTFHLFTLQTCTMLTFICLFFLLSVLTLHSIFLQIDVKFKVAATGGYYYPGHLPVLGE